MAVAQLVELSLTIPEVRGSNLVIGKEIIYIERLFTYCQLCIEMTKIKKKRPGMALFKKHVALFWVILKVLSQENSIKAFKLS